MFKRSGLQAVTANRQGGIKLLYCIKEPKTSYLKLQLNLWHN